MWKYQCQVYANVCHTWEVIWNCQCILYRQCTYTLGRCTPPHTQNWPYHYTILGRSIYIYIQCTYTYGRSTPPVKLSVPGLQSTMLSMTPHSKQSINQSDELCQINIYIDNTHIPIAVSWHSRVMSDVMPLDTPKTTLKHPKTPPQMTTKDFNYESSYLPSFTQSTYTYSSQLAW